MCTCMPSAQHTIYFFFFPFAIFSITFGTLCFRSPLFPPFSAFLKAEPMLALSQVSYCWLKKKVKNKKKERKVEKEL